MKVACSKKDLAESFIRLNGKPFSLEDYPFWVPVYEGQWDRTLFKCGRQVAKTETAKNLILTNSMAIDFFNTLYVAPQMKQASVFSKSRLQKTIDYSPSIQEKFTSASRPMSAWTKQFTNASEIKIGYAKEDPNRVRGITSDMNVYDEVQDITYEAVIPVVNECFSNSEYGWVTYLGTPKSMENTIEFLWQQSTQDEWLMKCDACNKYNYCDTVDSLGKKGPVCVKCNNYLNPRDGFWHSMNPGADIKGFHISQLIMPLNVENQKRWDRILHKFENISRSKFRNEVLGVSDAIGNRMVSEQELVDCCRKYTMRKKPRKKDFKNVSSTIAGVDWSGGGGGDFKSRTVVWVWGVLPDGRLRTMYYKIFNTNNPVQDVREVAEICHKWKCSYVVGDAGVGQVANAYLAEELGEDRVCQAQYSTTKKQIKWNNKDRYMVDKTSAIDQIMMDYKNQNVVFPKHDQTKPAIEDILAEYEEVTKNGDGKRKWSHSPEKPDDALHAQVFGWIASKMAKGQLEFYQAGQKAPET